MKPSIWRNPEIDLLRAEWRRNAGLALRIGKVGITTMLTLAVPVSIWWPMAFALPIVLGAVGMGISQIFWGRGDRAFARMQKLCDAEIAQDAKRRVTPVEAHWN